MSEMQLIQNDTFWKFLVSLEELKEKKDKTFFCASLNIDEDTLNEFQVFLNRFGLLCECDENYIYPLKEKCRIKMEFSLSEWLALQASFHKENDQAGIDHYFHRIIQNKLMVAKNAFEQFNLYRRPMEMASKVCEMENLKKKIDNVISNRKSITLEFFNNKECVVYPLRLVYLDGILCVVGENIHDKTLVYFGVDDIRNVNDFEQEYEAHISQIEVNEFICHLRLINGKEERLILKIYSQYEADLLPSHHYLGNPFVTSNSEGDMIWAATIEVCDDLLEWLFGMKDRVEVLDPGHVKKEFARYCEIKKENCGLKKAS